LEKDGGFDIEAPLTDAEQLVERIRRKVKERQAAGDYDDLDLSRAAALDLETELSEEDFLRYHLKVVERLSDVNYGDYEIVSKGGPFGRLEVLLKKTIWKLMRFYTYRLFSQQREFDCQVAEALASHYRWSREEIGRLREEVAELRGKVEGTGPAP
jgi:hypothetical protein